MDLGDEPPFLSHSSDPEELELEEDFLGEEEPDFYEKSMHYHHHRYFHILILNSYPGQVEFRFLCHILEL